MVVNSVRQSNIIGRQRAGHGVGAKTTEPRSAVLGERVDRGSLLLPCVAGELGFNYETRASWSNRWLRRQISDRIINRVGQVGADGAVFGAEKATKRPLGFTKVRV